MRKQLIGIDEAGRGPLAGPVSVGVVCVPQNFDWKLIPGVNDSKKLSEKKREEIYAIAQKLKKEGTLHFSVSMVSASVIDNVGIVKAIQKAIQKSLTVITKELKLSPGKCVVKLDGSLKASAKFTNQKTIIGGDAKEKVIGLASIMAKVTRDRYMVRIAQKAQFAPYNFHTHKGYGTQKHRASIQKHGLSTIHRKSYCKNLLYTK